MDCEKRTNLKKYQQKKTLLNIVKSFNEFKNFGKETLNTSSK